MTRLGATRWPVSRLWLGALLVCATLVVEAAAARPARAETPVPALAIVAVNGGQSPAAGTPFSVLVRVQDPAGAGKNVTSITVVTLSLKTGSGPLGGTLTGTIPAGTSQVTITGVSYTKAESGVALTASRTSGDVLAPGDSVPFTVRPGAMAGYTVSVSSPQLVGRTFSINANARDQFGNVIKTNGPLQVTLGSGSGHVLFDGNGDGTFGDNVKSLTGGTGSVNAKGTMAETTTVTVTDSSGKAGAAPLTIALGTLAFTTQPGTITAGSPIPGPPTVSVLDGFGNRINSPKASVTLAIGVNPASGALAGTTNKLTDSGIAIFDNLTISKPGNGYTLTASAAGFTSATSVAFTITPVTGGLTGTVTAASDHHRLVGAKVEALQANLVKASATTGADGTYSMAGLAAGSYDVRVSATGYRSLTNSGIAVTNGNTTSSNFTLDAIPSVAIRISTPTTGSVLHEPSVIVQGEVSGVGAIGVTLTTSLTMRGQRVDWPVPIQINGGRFAGLVPLTPGLVELIATATDSARQSAQDSITITFQPDPPDYNQAVPPDVSPTAGFAPLTVTFNGSAAADPTVTMLDLDTDGDGRADFTLADFRTPPHQVTYAYQTEGLYLATMTIRDQIGQSRTMQVPINVIPVPDLPLIWGAFRDTLGRGDLDGAAAFVALEARDRYRRAFSDLLADLPSFAAALGNITVKVVTSEYGTASVTRLQDGVSAEFLVHFLRDGDGVWRIASM